jgi:anti-sigma regulatory factor (Ser/Thr protein kinase)
MTGSGLHELERARLLAAIARDAAASSDLDDCLRAAMGRLHEAIRFKGGSLAFPDDDGLLAIRVAVGVIDEAALAVRLRPGQGIVGTVFSSGRSFCTGDLDGESRVTPMARQVGTNRLIRSFLCVPLTHQGTVVGILEIDSASNDAFSAEDQELVETAATVLAGVVSLAHIAERERAARLARDDFFAAVTATVDPARIEQVVANLVENAAKYSPAGAPIEIHLVQDGAELELTIADHGPGIPLGDRDRIFDRYTRVGPLREAVHGLGLGLFVVRIAVAAHGGTVVVGDRADGGSGAAISVRLPLVPPAPPNGPLGPGGTDAQAAANG